MALLAEDAKRQTRARRRLGEASIRRRDPLRLRCKSPPGQSFRSGKHTGMRTCASRLGSWTPGTELAVSRDQPQAVDVKRVVTSRFRLRPRAGRGGLVRDLTGEHPGELAAKRSRSSGKERAFTGWPSCHAATCVRSVSSAFFSGLRATVSIGSQLRVAPDQRRGWRRRARS